MSPPEASGCRDTILILDDDLDVRDSLRALLEAHNFNVLDYPNGVAFLAAYRPGLGRCLLLDLLMPEMDGRAVLAELSARPSSDLAIILITASDVGILAGTCDFLRKPISPTDMISAVRAAVRA